MERKLIIFQFNLCAVTVNLLADNGNESNYCPLTVYVFSEHANKTNYCPISFLACYHMCIH
jgi:hypothetical protein